MTQALARLSLLSLALGACHTRHVARDGQSMGGPPRQEEVRSERPVRTTPGGMLDGLAMRKIQRALSAKGERVGETGKLDRPTQAALRRFQRSQDQPATGMPDYDTVRRLGLDVKDIYLGGTHRRDADARPEK
jgi:hypothetical protein